MRGLLGDSGGFRQPLLALSSPFRDLFCGLFGTFLDSLPGGLFGFFFPAFLAAFLTILLPAFVAFLAAFLDLAVFLAIFAGFLADFFAALAFLAGAAFVALRACVLPCVLGSTAPSARSWRWMARVTSSMAIMPSMVESLRRSE